MIVLDASVVVELLVQGPLADRIGRELARADESILVPHLIDVEVMSALRRLAGGQRIEAHRTGQFLAGNWIIATFVAASLICVGSFGERSLLSSGRRTGENCIARVNRFGGIDFACLERSQAEPNWDLDDPRVSRQNLRAA